MGTPVPDEFPVFVDEKWYHAEMHCYHDAGPADDCTQTYVGKCSQCITGASINFWLDAGLECLAPFELILFSGFTAQRLICGSGPYDSQAECIAAHPL